MAEFHSRSNSFPSQSHPVMDGVEDLLCRLRSSSEATSVCANSASLRDLHDGINNLIQMPSARQAISQLLLKKSLGLVDLCGFTREVLILTKGSVQELQSSIRRNGGASAAKDDVNAYMASRKKINKMVNKYIKNVNISDKDSDLKGVARMLKETGAFDVSVLKSVLLFCSAKSKKRTWSFFSKRNQDCGAEDSCSMKQLKAFETTIQDLEEELEAFFRSLVKTRVCLLNALNH